MKRSPLKPGASLKRTSFARGERIEAREVSKLRNAPARKAKMKSKERAVTSVEKLTWDRLANEIGCVACMKDGNFNPHVSIHHVDGRTKPGCHQLVLPLCSGHHQDGTGEDKSLIAVHPWKARFEARYGTQAELMALCAHLLKDKYHD